MSRQRNRAVPLYMGLMLLLGVGKARAGPLFELTGGSQGMGGFNARTAGPSSASAYFNPALLPHAEPGLELGLVAFFDHVSIDLDARPGPEADIPEGVRMYGREDLSALSPVPMPTAWLEDADAYPNLARPRQSAGTSDNTRFYQTVGLVNHIFEERLVVGLHAVIPLGGFTAASAFYSDEREQYFSNSLHAELYSDRLTAAELAFAVGSAVYEKLSLGLSFTLNLKNQAFTPTYVSDAARLGDTLIDSRIDVATAVSPHFGVVFDAHPRLRLTATVHTQQSMEIETEFTYLLNSGQEQGSSIAFTHGFLPWSAALGASWDLLQPPAESSEDHRLSLVGTLMFSDWSDYRDRHDEQAHADYQWSKILLPAVGVRHAYLSWRSFFDVTFAASPVPPQTGRTNYVDNDRLGFNLGFDHRFPLMKSRLCAGLQVQVHRLLHRYQEKLDASDDAYDEDDVSHLVVDEVPDDAVDRADLGAPAPGREGLQTNNPGWPGFASQGWLLGGGAYVALFF